MAIQIPKELLQRQGELAYQLQQFDKEHPETPDSPWTSDVQERFDRINAEHAGALEAIDKFIKNAERIEVRKQNIQAAGETAFRPVGAPNLYGDSKVVGGDLPIEELRAHQKAIFFSMLKSEGGVQTAPITAAQYIEEHGLKGVKGVEAWDEYKSKPSKEYHAMVVRDQTLGGAAVPPQMYADIIRELSVPTSLIGKVRRVVATGPTLPFLRILGNASDKRYATNATGRIGVEEVDVRTLGSATTQDTPQTGRAEIKIHVWKPYPIFVSHVLAADAPMFEGEIQFALRDLYRLSVEDFIINGAGGDEPMGLLTPTSGDLAITRIPSGESGAFTYNGLMNLIFNLNEPYASDPSVALAMRRLSHGLLYQVKDDAGNYVLTPNMPVNTIMGVYPIVHSEFIPAAGADTVAAIFGAFRYWIWADREEYSVGRIDQVAWPDLYLQPYARFGGQQTVGNAFRALKLSVS